MNALRATVMVISAVVVALVVPHQANAWNITPTDQGFLIQRTAADPVEHSALTVARYHGYTSGPFANVTSYASGAVNFASAIYSTTEAVVIPAHESAGRQMILVSGRAASFDFQPSPVAVQTMPDVKLSQPATVTVGNPLTIESAPPVSLDSSVSIEGTLPVSVESIGPLTTPALGALGVVVFGLGGFLLGRGLLT